MKEKLHTYTQPDDAFIITSPTYKTLMQSTLPAFLKFMDGYGEYNKKDDVFKMNHGGIVYCRTETDPDSIIGITNVKHIWGDEAGKYRLYFWENMQARADFCGCGIDLTTSPYSLNWVYKDLIKPWRMGKRPDLEVIQAASWENPYHSLNDPNNLSQKRGSMDIRRFNMLYGGEWGKMEGLVYDCWDDALNLIAPFHLPTGTRYIAGVDWGYYPDPFVIKVRAITPNGNHYGISEFVKTKLTLPMQVEVARQKKELYGIEKFLCDPSQPGSIAEFNRNGLTAEGANNDIRPGIDLHYEMIKTQRYKEFIGACPHSADERSSYHYPEPKDLGPDQDSKELKPVGQNDHCMDVDRYITIGTYRATERKAPRVPLEAGKKSEDQIQRMKRLMKSKRSTHTEDWS